MRMLLNVQMPHEPFNTLAREGKVGAIIGRILEEIKPEAVYFTEQNGTRAAGSRHECRHSRSRSS
jgi:hypothetical protein